MSRDEDGFEIGKAIVIRNSESSNKKVLLISTGAMTSSAIKVSEELAGIGIESIVLHVHTIKPLDSRAIIEQAQKAMLIVTLEDHTIIGGLGSACLEALADNFHPRVLPPVLRIGLPDIFVHEYGTQESLMKRFELLPEQIVKRIMEFMNKPGLV